MDYIDFWRDGNSDQQDDREAWEVHTNYVPSKFVRLVCAGVDVDTAAAIADDGLPVCDDPPEVAEDDGIVVEWIGMYEEAF